MILIKEPYVPQTIVLTYSNGNVTNMTIENLQSHNLYNIELVPFNESERANTYNIVFVDDNNLQDFSNNHTQAETDSLETNHFLYADDLNYLYFPEGEYKYTISDGETGLLKTAWSATIHQNYDNSQNNVIYYGA